MFVYIITQIAYNRPSHGRYTRFCCTIIYLTNILQWQQVRIVSRDESITHAGCEEGVFEIGIRVVWLGQWWGLYRLPTEMILAIIHYQNRILDFGVGTWWWWLLFYREDNKLWNIARNILVGYYFLFLGTTLNCSMIIIIYSYLNNNSLYFLRYSLVQDKRITFRVLSVSISF